MRKVIECLFKFWFYISSFLPLYLLLIIQNLSIRGEQGEFLFKVVFWKQFYDSVPHLLFWSSTFFAIILSVIFIIFFKVCWLDQEGNSGKIIDESLGRGDTLGYIVTYIVPLLSMDIGSIRSLVINFILFLIIGIFYIKDNQLFMNPIFNFMGYRVLMSDDNVYITKLSRKRLKEIVKDEEDVIKIHISGDIFIIKEVR